MTEPLGLFVGFRCTACTSMWRSGRPPLPNDVCDHCGRGPFEQVFERETRPLAQRTEFANPYLRCAECNTRVRTRLDNTNEPCGHRASFESVCPSWGPVNGCKCLDRLGTVEHEKEEGPNG